MPDAPIPTDQKETASDDSSPVSDSPVTPSAKEPRKDQAIHNAFTLGWDIVELTSRVKIALVEPNDSGLRLASTWRAAFNQIAALQIKTFPNSATARTLYEPPPKKSLPYLNPPEPDYANLGISGMDTSGKAILDDFKLYEVTRRAINCLTLLYVKEDESLIPDAIKQFQESLIASILTATQNPGGGGGVVEPTEVISEPQTNLQKAKEALTERTVKFLDAWDGYLRETYYTSGAIPNEGLELIAYEAGRSMSSLSWGISAATVPLEQQVEAVRSQPEAQNTSGQLPDTTQAFVTAWQTVFRDQAVIRLQHQISALSAALDDAYYLQHDKLDRIDDHAVLVASNPDLPSQAIQAVKQSIDYWQLAVGWIPVHLDERRLSGDMAPDDASWGKPMRLALTEQSNVWQTLMTGQQTLRAYSMESVTHQLMQEVMDEVRKHVQTDFNAGVQQAERAMNEAAAEVNEAIERVGKTAVEGMESLFKTFVRFLWPILGVIAVLFIVLVVVALASPQINSTAAAASGGVGITGVISAILGYFGLGHLTAKKTEQQTNIQTDQNSATAVVKSKATAANASDGSPLSRIEGVAQETGTWVVQALQRGYEQVQIMLGGLSCSVAVSYPLVEFFGLNFKLESDAAFLTRIIWSGTEREKEMKQVLLAAFGPLAVLITPSTSGSEGDDTRKANDND